jgi:hypothetical protein
VVYTKQIIYCDERATLACDGNCRKAWGVSGRPRVKLSENPDDYAFLADDELGEAPEDTGTYEGGEGKPFDAEGPEDMNKWCARECERSVIVQGKQPINLPDFSKRLYNIPSSDPNGEG